MSNTGKFRQNINAKITSNNNKDVSAAKVREVLTDAADSIDEIFETLSLADSIGEYNASTGVATLTDSGATSTPGNVPAFPNGKYLDVVVSGTKSITGSAVSMIEGGKIIVRGTKWGYIPPSDFALRKVNEVNKIISSQSAGELSFAWKDINGKLAAYIESSGAFRALKWVVNSIPSSALMNFNGSDKINSKSIDSGLLTDDLTARLLKFINIPGFKFVWNDTTGRYVISISDDGTVSIPKLNSPALLTKRWNGKKCLCIGDSVTASGKYQPWLSELTGMTVSTHAKGGIGLVAMVDGDGASTDPILALTAAQLQDKDFVTIFGALNDRSRLVGVRSDMYPTQQTIYGRLNYVINKIYTLAATVNRKDIRIVLIAPHKVGKYSYIDADGGQEYPAGSGQTLESIVNAIKDTGAFYGIPVVNLYQNSGINNYTWDIFTANTVSSAGPYPANADNVHPNDAGYKLIGQYISSQLNQL